MHIFRIDVRLLIYFLPIAHCYVAQPGNFNIRDNTPAPKPRELVDISQILAEETTIKLVSDDEPQVLDYTSGSGAIGMDPTRDAAIFLESNYGIWGCRISVDKQNAMVNRAGRASKISAARPASINRGEYESKFHGGCLLKMRSQLETWKENGPRAGGPTLMVSAAHLSGSWTNQKVGLKPTGRAIWERKPSFHPFITEAAKDIASELWSHFGPSFIPLLGPRSPTKEYPDKGIVIRHFDSPDKSSKMVEVISSGHESPHGSPQLNQAVIEIKMQHVYKQAMYFEDDYDASCPFFAPVWTLAENVKPPYDHVNAPVAFGGSLVRNDLSGLIDAAGPF